MADNKEKKLAQDLNYNALLMLSFFGKSDDLTAEEKEEYRSMLSFEDASTASIFLLSVAMGYYAAETGRTKDELIEHLRAILFQMADVEP